MAKRKVVLVGNETLRAKCRPVEKITPRILQLLDDMAETMHAKDGCGLAAPQVGVRARVVIVETEPGELIEMINPEIIKTSGEQREDEGCLSVPGVYGTTVRPMEVTVRALDRHGKPFTVSGSGLKARAFCHEIDHLDGILFVDHAKDLYRVK